MDSEYPLQELAALRAALVTIARLATASDPATIAEPDALQALSDIRRVVETVIRQEA